MRDVRPQALADRCNVAAVIRHSAEVTEVQRPVVALSHEYGPGFVDPQHTHHRAQLLFASMGLMYVVTDDAGFVIPPQRAVWIPAEVRHEVSYRGPASLRTLYVDPSVCHGLPDKVRVIEVSDLLRELILRAMAFPPKYDIDGFEGRVMRLILEEIDNVSEVPLLAPMPRNARILRICRAMLADPTSEGTLDDWARKAAMSRRTFTRRFRLETGMTFGAWRQHVRLLEALSRLSLGDSISSVAHDIGYKSSSAFTSMFRRTFGEVPSEYFGKVRNDDRLERRWSSGGADADRH